MDAIVINKLSKKYELASDRPVILRNIFAPPKKTTVWALKDVSVKIHTGETVGIIGSNGSGKSTLLKIISGITTPSSGKVDITGRVGSLIELGAGFHPDLTGRENVFLNATLLGMTRGEIEKKYREIVEFAGIGEYINQSVRTYSSGMAVRLGFALAIHVRPDILLVDEVLAVGDEVFQKKCKDVIRKISGSGATILLVSHDLNLIDAMCPRSLLLANGKIQYFGATRKVVDRYLASSLATSNNSVAAKHAAIASVRLLGRHDRVVKTFHSGDMVTLSVDISVDDDVNDPLLGFYICNYHGEVLSATNNLWRHVSLGSFKAGSKVTIESRFKLPLVPGKYFFNVELAKAEPFAFLDRRYHVANFTVIGAKMSEGLVELFPTFKIAQK